MFETVKVQTLFVRVLGLHGTRNKSNHVDASFEFICIHLEHACTHRQLYISIFVCKHSSKFGPPLQTPTNPTVGGQCLSHIACALGLHGRRNNSNHFEANFEILSIHLRHTCTHRQTYMSRFACKRLHEPLHLNAGIHAILQQIQWLIAMFERYRSCFVLARCPQQIQPFRSKFSDTIYTSGTHLHPSPDIHFDICLQAFSCKPLSKCGYPHRTPTIPTLGSNFWGISFVLCACTAGAKTTIPGQVFRYYVYISNTLAHLAQHTFRDSFASVFMQAFI